jgi:hypothetical protein
MPTSDTVRKALLSSESRQALGQQLRNRALVLIGNAEIELRGLEKEVAELDRDGVVQTQPLTQGRPFFQTGLNADHLVHRVADKAEHGEGKQRDDDHHGQ